MSAVRALCSAGLFRPACGAGNAGLNVLREGPRAGDLVNGAHPRLGAFHDGSGRFRLGGTPVVHVVRYGGQRVYHGPAKYLGPRALAGDPPWTRTMNLEIKSLLLYQLS